jgi:putative ABC transport system permease protein
MWRRRNRTREDFHEEIGAHLAIDTDRLVAEGMSPADARAAARRAFGNVIHAHEQFYESRRVIWLDDLGKDARDAIRRLRQSPGFTAFAVVTMALGIGANTAIFSVVDALVLRSLPVAAPQRLFALSTNASIRPAHFSYATLEHLRDRVNVLDGVMGYTGCCGKSIVRESGGQRMVDRQFVTGEFFATLGIRPFRGRLLEPTDNEVAPTGGPVAVVSYRYWTEHLGGRDEAVGTVLPIDGTSVTIVGVTPPEFFGTEVGRVVDLLIPERQARVLTSSPFDDDNDWLHIVVRLKPGVSVATATAMLRAAQPHIRAASMPKQLPSATFLPDPFTLEAAAGGLSTLRQRFERPLVVTFVVVALVLVIACANIANLLLARGVVRRRELSLRMALGASRWHLVRQVLAEGVLVAAIGAVIGVGLASWATRILLTELSTADAPILLEPNLDWSVLAFGLAAMAATALLSGLVPALLITRVAPMEALKGQGRASGGARPASVSNSLVMVQVGVSLVLIVGAGLFVRTLERLVHRSLGFEPGRALVVMVTAPTIPAVDRAMVFQRLAQTLQTVLGVTAVGGALNPPLVGGLIGDVVVSTPGTLPPPDAERIPQFDSITPGWFEAYGVRIERGRAFNERDTITAPPVMVVNHAFVHRLLPGRNVIGLPLALAFRFGGHADYPFGVRTIVGVVADSVFHSIRDPVGPMIYVPLAQREPIPQKDLYLGVRSVAGSPVLLERSLAGAIAAFNRDLAFSVQPLAQQVADSLAQERVMGDAVGVLRRPRGAAVGARSVWPHGVHRVATSARNRHSDDAGRHTSGSGSTRAVARHRAGRRGAADRRCCQLVGVTCCGVVTVRRRVTRSRHAGRRSAGAGLRGHARGLAARTPRDETRPDRRASLRLACAVSERC